MSWRRTGADYELFFNRDESRLRGRALAPIHYGHYLAPKDVDAGGTWIMVNEHGLTVCLLNYYGYESSEPREWVSRGELALRFVHCSTAVALAAQIRQLNCDHFRGFRLLAVDGTCAQVHTWDGQTLQSKWAIGLLTSSSFEQSAVVDTRMARYQSLALSERSLPDELLAFQRDHQPQASAWSVCMHRDDASTVSLTHVSVSETRVRMGYADGAPCEAELGAPLELVRVDAWPT